MAESSRLLAEMRRHNRWSQRIIEPVFSCSVVVVEMLGGIRKR
jgi:hypothetical protein